MAHFCLLVTINGRHLTPASSEWSQLWTPSPLWGQSTSLDSLFRQRRLSNTIRPVPSTTLNPVRVVAPVRDSYINVYTQCCVLTQTGNRHTMLHTYSHDIVIDIDACMLDFAAMHRSWRSYISVLCVIYHCLWILVACKQHWHHSGTMNHHRQCPKYGCYIFPHVLQGWCLHHST